jgi:hypothetical protein
VHCGLPAIEAIYVCAAVAAGVTAHTANSVAPAYYGSVPAVVSLLTVLTVRETAGRPLPQGAADEMFQSEADLHGAATAG